MPQVAISFILAIIIVILFWLDDKNDFIDKYFKK